MKYLLILLIILGFSGCGTESVVFERSLEVEEQNSDLGDIEGDIKSESENQDEDRELRIENSEEIAIPEEFDLPIKFASQSPFAVWDDLHNEACEEAAMIMASKYFKDENLDKQIMEDEIQALIKWETENGYEVDATAEETVEILKNYFGFSAEVTSEVTVERMKRELALGNLVITPHAGRELGNPYYRQPGPVYHFLVIRGWDEDEFITNDPGTKRGEGYKYKFDKLIETVHDWNEDDILEGERVMIVVYPQGAVKSILKVDTFHFKTGQWATPHS